MAKNFLHGFKRLPLQSPYGQGDIPLQQQATIGWSLARFSVNLTEADKNFYVSDWQNQDLLNNFVLSVQIAHYDKRTGPLGERAIFPQIIIAEYPVLS